MQTNLGTKCVCSLVTKSSNGFGYTNLDHSRSHKIEKKKKNGFGPFSFKFFVPIRVGLKQRDSKEYYRNFHRNFRILYEFFSELVQLTKHQKIFSLAAKNVVGRQRIPVELEEDSVVVEVVLILPEMRCGRI